MPCTGRTGAHRRWCPSILPQPSTLKRCQSTISPNRRAARPSRGNSTSIWPAAPSPSKPYPARSRPLASTSARLCCCGICLSRLPAISSTSAAGGVRSPCTRLWTPRTPRWLCECGRSTSTPGPWRPQRRMRAGWVSIRSTPSPPPMFPPTCSSPRSGRIPRSASARTHCTNSWRRGCRVWPRAVAPISSCRRTSVPIPCRSGSPGCSVTASRSCARDRRRASACSRSSAAETLFPASAQLIVPPATRTAGPARLTRPLVPSALGSISMRS